MRSSRYRWLALVALLLFLSASIVVGLEGPRSSAVRGVLATYLWTKGLRLSSADLSIDSHRLLVSDLAIDQKNDGPFLSVSRLRVDYQIRDAHALVTGVDLERPQLVLRRAQDGSFEVVNRFIGGSSQASGGSTSTPIQLHAVVRLHDGRVDLINQCAPVRTGRAITLRNVNLTAHLNQGALSRGTLGMIVTSAGGSSRLTGDFFENDVARLAQLDMHGRRIAVGPILNYFISSPAFAVETGSADVVVRGFAIGWPAGSSPAWSIAARGAFRDTRLRVVPLIVPVRGVAGPFSFVDGVLGLPHVTGAIAGVPLSGHGAILMQPDLRLDLAFATRGPLRKVRTVLAFLKPLPLAGIVAIGARVAGSPTDPHVGVGFSMPGGWRIATSPIGSTSGMVFYNHEHVTLPYAVSHYSGFAINVNGDIDVGSAAAPAGDLIATLRGPSTNIPWIANLDRSGSIVARATFSGPLAQPRSDGFIQLAGHETTIRAAFGADKDQLALGPLFASDPHGGHLWLEGSVGRTRDQATYGSLVADHFAVDLNGRRTRLAGIFNTPFGLPPASGVVDGQLVAFGPPDATQASLDLHGRRLRFAHASYGDADVMGMGIVTRTRVIDAISAIRLRGNGASIAGVPLRAVNAIIGLSGRDMRVYAATGHVAGGAVGFDADLRLGNRMPSQLFIAANGLQLSQISSLPLPHLQGEITALGDVSGLSRPSFHLSGTARELSVSGSRMSADAELTYNGASLRSHNSRILIDDGSAIDVNGSVDRLYAAAPLAHATLHINAKVHNADIAQLASLAPNVGLPVTGILNGDIAVGGSPSSPSFAGDLDSDVGTLRGVTYGSLHAKIAGAPGMIGISDGRAVIRSSQLYLNGSMSGASASMHLATPHVDLADFNDFFGGKDVLAGSGAADIAIAVAPSHGFGQGWLRLRDLAVQQIPFGTLDASVSTPRRDEVAVGWQQHGPAGHGNVVADLDFAGSRSTAGSIAPASYALRADFLDIDLSRLAPIMPSAANGLRGRLAVHASARGSAGRVHGVGSFSLADGYVRKDRINALDGRVVADDRGIALPNFHLNAAGLDVVGNGSYAANRRISAQARIAASNVRDVERLANLPHYIDGPAVLNLTATGTTAAPRVHAMLAADRGTAFAIDYDHAGFNAEYSPGRVDIHDASVALAHRRGTVSVVGSLPVVVGPQPPRRADGPRSMAPLLLHLNASGVELAAFDPLLRKHGSLDGWLNMRATATGSLTRPLFSGSASLRQAVVRSDIETVPLTGLNADATFSNERFDLVRLHGNLGKGTIDAHGTANLQTASAGTALGRAALDLHLATRHANLTVPKLFSGVLDADASLNTAGARPALKSNIIISDTDVPFTGILALASGSSSSQSAQTVIPGVPPYRKHHVTVYGGQIYGTTEPQTVQPTAPPLRRKHISAPLALNVNATAGDNVQVTGLVNATGAGTVHVGGTLGSPRVSGELTTVRGDVSAFDTVFHIMRGLVVFHPRDGLLPTIDARAMAFRPEADVTVTVYGRVDQLHTSFESDPPMSQQAILADMLHINDINNALSGGGQTPQAGMSLTNVAGNVLTGKLLSALNFGLERTLNIEEVDIAFNQNGQPTLEVRKQYGKNLYALYRSSFSAPPDQEVGMVFTPHNYLEVQWLQKQNTAGQTFSQQGQTTTFQLLYHLPNKPPSRHHQPGQAAGLQGAQHINVPEP